jgi:hypothetical protein
MSAQPFVVGDRLYCRTRWHLSFSKVERVTPTGIAVLTKGTMVNPNGRERGSAETRIWQHVTPEVEAEDARRQLLNRVYSLMQNIECKKLTNEQASAVIAILESVK